MKIDVEALQQEKMVPIKKVAEKIGLEEEDLEFYGKYKAKIDLNGCKKLKEKKDGKLVLVTAINPTPAGEGKTTVSIGLAQAMFSLNKKAVLALREPSLGPVFGMKGGATGGGKSLVIPMQDINLHFTGDMHAVTSANNLLCALLDSHIHNGNALKINPKTIEFKRCLDVNDRTLRNIVIGLGSPVDGTIRQDGFVITAASEIMAIFCLATDFEDLKKRFGNIFLGFNYDKEPVFAKDLKAQGAMAALFKDAFSPNLVQTLENTPALIHGGPFANIAHGCNSVVATKLALKLGEFAITEAGFGSDLGMEKFFDIKCRKSGLKPNCVVLVATVRALKYNGGALKQNLEQEDKQALKKGLCNLKRHIKNVGMFCSNLVVAINKFSSDTDEEIEILKDFCKEQGVNFAVADVFGKGGQGAVELANEVLKLCENDVDFNLLYDDNLSLKEKIEAISTKVYGADGVFYEDAAEKKLKNFSAMGFDSFPVCIAKTQYSFSTDPKKLGSPTNFTVTVKDVKLSSGAGFVVVITNNIMTMPGLIKTSAANFIDLVDGKIVGVF